MTFSRCSGASRGIGLIGVSALLLLSLAGPALAHPPFGMAEGSELKAWQGLVSGIGHPLLGPDHLLFLLAIGFIGLGRPVAWVLPLLASGLLGAALTQVVPLSADLAPLAEALVSLSLALEGLIALGSLPTALLLPVMGLHGYLLGGTIVGAEPTPLFAYFFGLFLGQGALLLAVCFGSRRWIAAIGENGRRLAAGIWIGIGAAFAWTALVA